MTYPKNANLLFAYLSLFYLGFVDNLRGPLYPEILATFSLSHAEGAWFFGLASLGATVASLFTDQVLQRTSYRNLFLVSVGLMLASQVTFAFALNYFLFLLGAVFWVWRLDFWVFCKMF